MFIFLIQLPALPVNPNPMPDVLPRHTGPINLNPEQLAKLRSELDTVQGNMKVFSEMLTELTPGKEHPQDLELLQVKLWFRYFLLLLIYKYVMRGGSSVDYI